MVVKISAYKATAKSASIVLLDAVKGTHNAKKTTINAMKTFVSHHRVDTVPIMTFVLREYAFQEILIHHKFVISRNIARSQTQFVPQIIAEINVRSITYAFAKPLKNVPLVTIVTAKSKMEDAFQDSIVQENMSVLTKKIYAIITNVFIVHQTAKKILIVVMT